MISIQLIVSGPQDGRTGLDRAVVDNTASYTVTLVAAPGHTAAAIPAAVMQFSFRKQKSLQIFPKSCNL